MIGCFLMSLFFWQLILASLHPNGVFLGFFTTGWVF